MQSCGGGRPEVEGAVVMFYRVGPSTLLLMRLRLAPLFASVAVMREGKTQNAGF